MRYLRTLRTLLFGCPVCTRHRKHLTFCRYGWRPR